MNVLENEELDHLHAHVNNVDETIDNEFNNQPQQVLQPAGMSVIVTVTITSTRPVEVTVSTIYNHS